MKLKDAVKILNKNNGQHLDQIYLPIAGRNVVFSPLTTADVKVLTRNNIFDTFDLNIELLKLGLFDKLCNEDLASEGISSHTITQIDYLSFLIGIRKLLNNTLSYKFTCRKCNNQFKYVLDLEKEFDEDIKNFKPQHETLELIATDGRVFKFELENFTMEDYLYYRYVMNKLNDSDYENPDVVNEIKYIRPILYIKSISIDDEEIEDWKDALLPAKLTLYNQIPPNITFGTHTENDTNIYEFVTKTFAEEKLNNKIRNITVSCPQCGQEYKGIFNFDGFFIF